MSQTVINLISALSISVIITLMAHVKSQRVKAILYTLPFPITIALIGSKSIATSLSLTGLMLTASFLWGCYFVHSKLRVPILYTDILLAATYVVLAYILAHSLHISFWVMLLMYVVGWSLLMLIFQKLTFKYSDERPAHTNYAIKAVIVFVIAYILFSLHQHLAAFVVTFPYNGVFAVFENRFALLSQAALFTRNSLALAAYFVANYLAGIHYPAVTRYILSWLAFGAVLLLVNMLVKVRVQDRKRAAAT